MDKDDYELASKILASKHRTNITLALLNGAMTPTELADQFDEHQPTISRALGELRNMGIVDSTSQQRGRLYWIEDGKQDIAEYIQTKKGE